MFLRIDWQNIFPEICYSLVIVSVLCYDNNIYHIFCSIYAFALADLGGAIDPPGQNFFIFMQFSGNFGQIVG